MLGLLQGARSALEGSKFVEVANLVLSLPEQPTSPTGISPGLKGTQRAGCIFLSRLEVIFAVL